MGLLRLSIVGGVGLVCLLALGCNREEPIKAYQAPKEPAHAHHDRLEWKTPGQWIEWPGPDELTYSGFTVEEGQPPLEMTISALPRGSPGAADVLANVNRWRRQLGMPGSSREEVRQLVKKVMVDERPVFVVELPGPAGGNQKRTLAAMAVHGDRVWFLKLMGPSTQVEKHRGEFDAFVASLKFNGPRDTIPQREMNDGLAWTKPAGWENGGSQDPNPMQVVPRVVTLFAGDPLDPAQVVVTKLGGMSFGSILDNINRWRAQVGLPAVAKEDDQPKQQIQLAGNPAVFFDFSGPGNPDNPNQRMLLVMSMVNDDVWFFKMTGAQQVVESEKGKFDEFLKSVEFEK